MRYILLFTSLVVFLSFKDKTTVYQSLDDVKNPYPPTESNLLQGKKTYTSLCYNCHGEAGEGNGPTVPTLKVKPADFTSEKIQNKSDALLFISISNGKGEMKPYKNNLSVKERWLLILYIRSLK